MDTNYLSRDKYGMYSDDSGAGPGPKLMGAETLIGNSVFNPEGEDLGKIREFMIDMDSGEIAYAVLSVGGFLGIADKLFAVPWRALKLDTEHHRFTLKISREVLQHAPGFDKNQWPSMADEIWARDVHHFYGTPYRPGG
jgi:sporulation protein YlmC with PRC-barrel domain